MNNNFVGIEREIIIKNLQSELPKLIISPLDTTINSIVISEKSYSIIKNEIIYFNNLINPLSDKVPIKVFFYYKGRGVYFLSSFRLTKSGYAIVIPKTINKHIDSPSEQEDVFTCSLYFLSGQKSTIHIPCYTFKNYSLFDINDYPQLEQSQKISDIKKLKSLDSFFTEKLDIPQSVEQRIEPLYILFLSNKQLVFASTQKDMILKIGFEYAVKISVPLQVGTRIIYATIKVDKITGDSDVFFDISKTAALCSFTQLKEEDSRFLYEKLYKKNIQ